MSFYHEVTAIRPLTYSVSSNVCLETFKRTQNNPTEVLWLPLSIEAFYRWFHAFSNKIITILLIEQKLFIAIYSWELWICYNSLRLMMQVHVFQCSGKYYLRITMKENLLILPYISLHALRILSIFFTQERDLIWVLNNIQITL